MIQRMFVTLDTKKTNYKNVGKINHGDDLILELTVLSDGDMISFNDPMVDLLVKKSDGKMIRQNSGIEHIKPNKFVIEVSKDCVTSPGLSTNQLIINDNGRISTCMFYYTILNSLEEDIIESISNVEVLEQLDEFVIQIQDKMELFDDELLNKLSNFEDAIKDLEEFFGDTSVELLEAELSRNEAEQSRAQAELVRVQNESRRLQNDLDLANAEAERVRAENIRIQNEVDRALVDAVMDQKESEREDSELERIQNESKRITDEVARQQNENTRQSNESIRMSNETDRKTQENRRVTAETNRVNAETTRRNNENSRISNETERQKTMNELKSLINNVNGVIDERVGVIEDEIDEINSSLDNLESEVNELKKGNIEIDLTNYVTKNELSTKADKTELHSHTNKSVLDSITTSKVNQWDNIVNEFNDHITNHPSGGIDERIGVIEDEIKEINSSLDNIVTEEEVNETIGGVVEDLNDIIIEINNINSSLDNITNEFNEHITNHPSGGIDDVHGFDERIRVIEDDINEINSSLDNLTNRVDNIENNNEGGDIGFINTVEPQWNDIPKLSFNGDVTSMSKETYCTLDFTYRSNTMCYYGKAKLKWQGSSSLTYSKKNYTIRLLEKDGKTKKYINFKGWGRQEKFVLKANFVDSLHLRNLAGARIAYDMITSRSDFEQLPHEMQTSPRCNTIDGFPVKIYMNDELYGIYTMNIPKDKWAYNLEEGNVNHAFLMAEKNNNGNDSTSDKLVLACEFRENATIFADTSSEQYPPYDWVVEAPGDDVGENIRVSFNNLINCVKDTTDTEFKSTIGNYLDLTATFDYYCFSYLCCHYDGLGKNLGMITYDGIKWYPTLYDMDSIFGANIDGTGFLETDRQCPEQYQESHSLLWERIEKCFAKELYARYKELRADALSIGNIMSRCEQIYDIISDRMYSEDAKKWSNIPSQNTNTIDRIRSYMKSRAEYVDNEFELFNIGPVPVPVPVPVTSITLNKTTTTVYNGKTETLTVTYTPSNTTQKGIIWESSDTSIATVDNGVVSGLSDGECIITAKSSANSSIVSTCSVTVETKDTTDLIGHFDNTNNFSSDLSGNNMILVLNGYSQDSNNPLVLEQRSDKIAYIQDNRFSSEYTIEIDFETTSTNEGYILCKCRHDTMAGAWNQAYMFGVSADNQYVVIGDGFDKITLNDNVVGDRHKFKLIYENGTITCNIDDGPSSTVTKNINVDCLYFGSNGVSDAFRGSAKIYSIKIWG